MISDFELLNTLKNNSDTGLELIMEIYSGLVYTIIYNQLKNQYSKEDIEECVSDVFIYIFNNIDKIDLEKGTLKGYLSIISKRKAIDLYRKHSLKNNLQVPYEEYFDNIFHSSEDTFTSVSQKETNKLLIDAINSLGEPDKTIIIRKYFFLEKSKDISKIVGLKSNTIDKRVSRAMEKLNKLLGGVL